MGDVRLLSYLRRLRSHFGSVSTKAALERRDCVANEEPSAGSQPRLLFCSLSAHDCRQGYAALLSDPGVERTPRLVVPRRTHHPHPVALDVSGILRDDCT